MPADERFYLRYFTILKRHTEEKKKKKRCLIPEYKELETAFLHIHF